MTRPRIMLLLILIALSAGQPAAAQDPLETASLRVLHLSPDAPLVDVIIEGRLHVRDLGLRDRSPFLSVPAGRHVVRVYPHRLPTADEDAVLPPGGAASPDADASPEGDATDAGPPAEDGASATGAAGEAPGGPGASAPPRRPRTLEPVTAVVQLEAGTYTTLVLTGNFELPASDARRGYLSLDVEPPEAAVAVSGPQGYRVQRSGDQLLADLEPGAYEIEVQLEGYQDAVYGVDVPAGGTAVATVTLQKAEGEEDGGVQVDPFLQPEEAQGIWRRLELQPYASDGPLSSPGRALVRFVHVAPIVPQLDVRGGPLPPIAGGEEGGEQDAGDADPPSEGRAGPLDVEGLAYPNGTEYLDVPAGRYALAFRIAGSDLLLYEVPELDLRPGLTYTLFVAAGPTSGEIWIVPSVDAAVLQRPSVRGGPR